MTTMTVEYGAGEMATVVGTYSGEPYFIIERGGLYAACVKWPSFDEDQAWSFVNEESPWRDSLTDASCDVDIAMQAE